jgi:geranylgeranyl pyrophosphate synthase
LLVSEAIRGDKLKALEFASAIEMIHQGSILHDNILDEHKERRGTIPLNLLKGAKFAVLAGDRMFSFATSIAAKSGNKEASEVADAMEAVLSGAMKELSVNEFFKDILSGDVSSKFYFKMIGLKTAGLFKSAGKFGAMSSTQKEDLIKLYGDYGHSIGVAYQIADDLTDIIKMGEGEKEPDMGSVISIIPAVFNYNKDYARKAPFMLMSGRISIDKVLEMITSIDMSSKMKEDIQKNIDEAVLIIEASDIQNEYTELLKEYPEYCVNKILDEVGEKL